MNAPYTPLLDQMRGERDQHEAACRAGTLYPDDELLRRAIGSAIRRARRRGMVAWGGVTDTFTCGSTVAIGLCRRFGFDPETGQRT